MPSEQGAGGVAWLFPGQGAQSPGMLEPFKVAPDFGPCYEQICTLAGLDPLACATASPDILNGNLVGSLLTVLASSLAVDMQRAAGEPEPAAVAGYSVGQWTALYAAGALDKPTLLSLVARRARCMNDAAQGEPGGMLAVIGVTAARLETLCAEVRDAGHLLQLTNDNAPGQATLGGSMAGLALAEAKLTVFKPRLVTRVPVAGAWHTEQMRPAVAPLAAIIDEAALQPLRFPVIDNTSGRWLPAQGLTQALAVQVAVPVRWQQGVRNLVALGVHTCLELGYGDLLTRFGFFIDRSVRHQALVPSPRTAR